jgi:DNA-binding NarL/FixJ family response regulator
MELERQQAQQWLAELAAALEPWRLVIVSGNHLFAGVMVWTYPGAIFRAASVADLRALLQGEDAVTEAESPAPTGATATPTSGHGGGPTGGPCGARRPMPQQILPIGSAPPGCLDPQADLLFFLLCDDLPDGELEHALALLEPIPLERRRVLAVLANNSHRQRLRRLQEEGLDGLCTQGSTGEGRIFTAMHLIASGGTYLDPLFRQRLQESSSSGQVRSAHDLTLQERSLLREICRGYNSLEIAKRQGLADNSIRRYLSHTYQRLGVRDRAQSISWCVAHGLVSPADLRLIFAVEES